MSDDASAASFTAVAAPGENARRLHAVVDPHLNVAAVPESSGLPRGSSHRQDVHALLKRSTALAAAHLQLPSAWIRCTAKPQVALSDGAHWPEAAQSPLVSSLEELTATPSASSCSLVASNTCSNKHDDATGALSAELRGRGHAP